MVKPVELCIPVGRLGVARLPPVSGGKLRYRNRGLWLVLTMTSPVTYKIQYHARAEPEIVHVDKLLPYQADFKKELHSWLNGKELDGHQVAETQTADTCPLSPHQKQQ